MSSRRGPWLSGLIVALLGAVWLLAQVTAGAVAWVGHTVDGAGMIVMNGDVGNL
ncbi:hypothetical protein ACQ856_30390 (plasmid) [Mycolicibacterium psychrotolerans]|uniref:hypothetical protein n=1 Tax=Mycolicibacterium psychrotolerans TaxID=216929 RepID=UPI003D6772A9